MDENIKSSYYSILPAVVRYDKDLTDKAKLLYSEITCLCNKEGYCFATNNYFANLYNCTPRAIQFTISKLQEKGYIKIIVEMAGLIKRSCFCVGYYVFFITK